jgi:hypothetical protein
VSRFHSRIREVQKAGFHVQNRAGLEALLGAKPRNVVGGEGPKGFRHLAPSKPYDDHTVAARALSQYRPGDTHFVIRVSQSYQKGLLRHGS